MVSKLDNSYEDSRIKQRRWNPGTLAKLKECGVDIETPVAVRNTFYTKDRNSWNILQDYLKNIGESISVCDTLEFEGQNFFYIETLICVVPDLSILNDMTDRCVLIAAKFGAEYDGWFVDTSE